jgi:hypothetical protein
MLNRPGAHSKIDCRHKWEEVAMATDLDDWRPIAEQVTKETDPEKLSILLVQLCRALDERAARRTGQAADRALPSTIRDPDNSFDDFSANSLPHLNL